MLNSLWRFDGLKQWRVKKGVNLDTCLFSTIVCVFSLE